MNPFLKVIQADSDGATKSWNHFCFLQASL